MRSLRFAVLASSLVPAAVVAQKPRDLTKLDPCKILTSADVAAATNGKVATSAGGGAGANACMWVVDAKSGAGSYQLFLHKPDLIEALWKVESAGEKGTPVAGLWNEAYLSPPGGMHAGVFILTALKPGDMAIEIHGVNKDAVVSLGKTVVSRIK